MTHHAPELGLVHLEVHYEQLVADAEAIIHLILARLELPFEENCLEHTRSSRLVSTASKVQVTQPIYTGANTAWRNYAHLVSNRLT